MVNSKSRTHHRKTHWSLNEQEHSKATPETVFAIDTSSTIVTIVKVQRLYLSLTWASTIPNFDSSPDRRTALRQPVFVGSPNSPGSKFKMPIVSVVWRNVLIPDLERCVL